MNAQSVKSAYLHSIAVGSLAAMGTLPVSGDVSSTTEWLWHQTSDGLHPDAEEQQMVWLMNRARADPHREGMWLANTGDYMVEVGLDQYDVNLDLLQEEFEGPRYQRLAHVLQLIESRTVDANLRFTDT